MQRHSKWVDSARQVEAIGAAQPHEVTDLLQLPEVWAGFPPDLKIEGDGPKLDGLCSRLGLSRQQLMTRRRRDHEGLQLYPLDFTSHVVEHARLFVEPDASRCHGLTPLAALVRRALG